MGKYRSLEETLLAVQSLKQANRTEWTQVKQVKVKGIPQKLQRIPTKGVQSEKTREPEWERKTRNLTENVLKANAWPKFSQTCN